MDNKGVANQRKNHVLADSSSRLKNLLKGEHSEDESEEMKPPSDSVKPRRTSPRSKSPKKVEEPEKEKDKEEADEVVVEGDPATVRFWGYLQLHLYLFSMVVGAFLCYTRHHSDSPDRYPRLVRNMFLLLKNKNTHVLAEKGFKFWNSLPEVKRKKYVKYLSYGTIFVNLYPVLMGPSKPKKKEGEEVQVQPELDLDLKFNKAVVDYGSRVFRTLSAAVLCGLVGYDLAYNMDFFKALFSRFLKK